MRRLLLPFAALFAGCVLRAGPPASKPPPARPPPAMAHTALDAAGAASVARQYAWSRGLPSEVKKVARGADHYDVDLKVDGNGWKGRMRVQVDAFSGAVVVLEEKLQPHERGKHKGWRHD